MDVPFGCANAGQAILHSKDAQDRSAQHLKGISQNTNAVVFMGTPLRGSKHADLAGILMKILKLVPGITHSHSLISELQPSVRNVDENRNRFCAYLRTRRDELKTLGVSFFCEELETGPFGLVSMFFKFDVDYVLMTPADCKARKCRPGGL